MLDAVTARHLFDYDLESGILTRRIRRGVKSPAGQVVGYPNQDGYLVTHVDERTYSVHRIAWLMMTGSWPEYEIDHINGAPDDNRWSNLREATRAQNNRNTATRKDNSSGYRGVTFNKKLGRWSCVIVVDGVREYLGLFDTPAAAGAAYDERARVAYGQFYRAPSRKVA